MADLNLIRELVTTADTMIVLLVLDGLGGLPREPGGPTELEFAQTPNLDEQIKALADNWAKYDFFFVHYKYVDSRGEDGKFEDKAAEIEKVDAALPRILDQKPDVLIVTGDHSTPAAWKAHSWHPVPTLIYAPGLTRRNDVSGFGETECLKGALGQFPATDIMPMALAYAKRMNKFGA